MCFGKYRCVFTPCTDWIFCVFGGRETDRETDRQTDRCVVWYGGIFWRNKTLSFYAKEKTL